MLRVENLRVIIDHTPILRGLDFTLDPGATLGLVGESGSGKSMTALAIMGLLPPRISATGRILLEGQDLLTLSESALCSLRGRHMAMVFQEPMTALNPVKTIGLQIAEGMVLHGLKSRFEARKEAIRLLDRVGIDAPERRIHAFPHELSGGQRQRVMIAMAIACRPALLIADEPTSALDVTVQVEILDLLREIQLETGMAMLFISHDLAVVQRVARQTAVLYGGMVMETGETRALLAAPRHPYTRGLMNALPHHHRHGERLHPIPGHIPAPSQMPKGCPFYGRCDLGDATCAAEKPPLSGGETRAFCFHPLGGA